MERRFCVIGLDGVGPRNLEVVLSSTPLSGLSRILARGFRWGFQSVPPYTPIAWTSLFTGVNPGVHGVFGFNVVEWRDGRAWVRLATSCDVAYPRVFEALAMRGLRSVVVNVPLTYPPGGLVGSHRMVVVSDWASPRVFIHPGGLMGRYGGSLAPPPHDVVAGSTSMLGDREYVRVVEEYLESRMDVYLDLLETGDYSLYVVVFSETDWLMHRFPGLVDGSSVGVAYRVYSMIDRFTRRALDYCDAVALVSDHGFRVSKYLVSLNAILAREGLLRSKIYLNPGKLRNIAGLLRGRPSLRRIRRVIPLSVRVDYSRSRAFMVEASSWGIYAADPQALEATRRILGSLEYVKGLLDPRRLYRGPQAWRAPQLLAVPRGDTSYWTYPATKPVTEEPQGEHDTTALLALYGDNIEPAEEAKASIHSLTPTILAYLGQPTPKHAEAKPLTGEATQPPSQADYLKPYRTAKKLTCRQTP